LNHIDNKIINKNNNRTFNLNLKFENNLINFLTKNEQKWTLMNVYGHYSGCKWTILNMNER